MALTLREKVTTYIVVGFFAIDPLATNTIAPKPTTIRNSTVRPSCSGRSL